MAGRFGSQGPCIPPYIGLPCHCHAVCRPVDEHASQKAPREKGGMGWDDLQTISTRARLAPGQGRLRPAPTQALDELDDVQREGRPLHPPEGRPNAIDGRGSGRRLLVTRPSSGLSRTVQEDGDGVASMPFCRAVFRRDSRVLQGSGRRRSRGWCITIAVWLRLHLGMQVYPITYQCAAHHTMLMAPMASGIWCPACKVGTGR